MTRSFVFTSPLLGIAVSAIAQTTLLTADFNAALPAGWQQQPAASWTLNTTFAAPGGCIITEEVGSTSLSVSYVSPAINFSAYSNYTVSFKLAVTKNNFMSPEFLLGYTTANGTQTLGLWSDWPGPATTQTILSSGNHTYPLESENVLWQVCTHTVSSLGTGSGSLVFQSNIVNGGWLLLDSIVVKALPTATLATSLFNDAPLPRLYPRPNPCQGTLFVPLPEVGGLQVYDGSGKLLTLPWTTNSAGLELDLSTAPAGLYLLELFGAGGTRLYFRVARE